MNKYGDRFKYVRDSRKPNTYIALCPNCDDTSGHCEVDRARGLYFCHRCGNGGRVPWGDRNKGEATETRPRLVRDISHLEYSPMPSDHSAMEYLKSRGFTEHIIKFRLRPHIGPEWHRIYFPIYTAENQAVPSYYVGREWKVQHPKMRWIYPPCGKVNKSDILYQYEHQQRDEMLILVEGIFDAVWSTDRLAVLGSSISRVQMTQLAMLNPKSVILAFDQDAYQKSRLLAAVLGRDLGVPVAVVKFPPGVDLCDLKQEGTQYIADNMERVC